MTLTEEMENPAKVLFVVTRDDLYKIRIDRQDLDHIIRTILRRYNGIFTEFKAIDERELATLTGYTVEKVKELLENEKVTFYIGFDPTADSLHVGHFMALCLMKRLQMAGNKPIALIGGGTAMIGDPSGRSDMRQMMTKETIQHNCDCFKKQMERFIEFGEDKAIMVNNADWLSNLNYINFLRKYL